MADIDKHNYESKVLFFPTDYDKENPLTKTKGQMRILDYRIKKAKAEGTSEEEIKALEQQKEVAGQQKAYD